MKTRALIIVALATLCTAAPASAGTNKFTVALKSGGILSFNIKTNKKGNATKVIDIKLANVQSRCTDGAAGPTSSPALGSTRVRKSSSTGRIFFRRDTEIAGISYSLEGELKNKKGRSVRGSMEVNFETERGLCSASSNFSAKRGK